MSNELEDLLDGIQSDIGQGDDDDELSFDFTDAGHNVDFKKAAPAGTRPARIRSVKPGKSKAGNPKITFEFQILEPSAWRGKVMFSHVPASGSKSAKGKQILAAVGIEVDPDDPVLRFKRSEVVDQHVVIESEPQRSNPQYDEVLNVYPAGSRDLDEPDPDEE